MHKYCTITIKSENIFDCYIYKKILYIITRDKKVIPFDWFDFINANTPNEDAFTFVLSFLRGDVLYSKSFDLFRNTRLIRNDILNSFKNIKDHNYTFQLQSLLEFAQTQNWWRNIQQFPSEIRCYKNRLYFLQNDGLYFFEIKAGSTHQSSRNVLSKQRLCVKGNFVNFNFLGMDLYLCGLNDGLYVLNYYDSMYGEEMGKISDENTGYICTNYGSFLRGSYIGNSEFIKTKKEKQELREIVKRTKYPYQDGFSYFSLLDKIYRINGNVLEVANYSKDNDPIFEPLAHNLNLSSDDFVSATVAIFGLIIEEKNRLIVIPSDPDEEPLLIGNKQKPIISWRIYPSSIDYKNQLHVVFYDELVIYSFYYDYFVNQRNKKFGAKRVFSDFD